MNNLQRSIYINHELGLFKINKHLIINAQLFGLVRKAVSMYFLKYWCNSVLYHILCVCVCVLMYLLRCKSPIRHVFLLSQMYSYSPPCLLHATPILSYLISQPWNLMWNNTITENPYAVFFILLLLPLGLQCLPKQHQLMYSF